MLLHRHRAGHAPPSFRAQIWSARGCKRKVGGVKLRLLPDAEKRRVPLSGRVNGWKG
jgi:hypothetical protein